MGQFRTIVLASASPRRLALLEAACFDVEVRPADVAEHLVGDDIEAETIALARQKLDDIGEQSALTIAADTVVVLDKQLLGKPADAAEARRMLGRLAGRTHTVVTGFCLRRGDERRQGAVRTQVCFRELSPTEIERYIETQEPFDKAGAYGIQGIGGALIDRLDGSYTNVMGLPLREVIEAVGEIT